MQDDQSSECVMYRYKYREMNDTHLKIITDGTIYFSSPLDFNDPFDSQPAYNEQSIDDVFMNRPEMVKATGDYLALSPAKRIQKRGQIKQFLTHVVDNGYVAEKVLKKVGVFSLSREPCNPLMWAHYSANHTGFLVEFRIHASAPRHLKDRVIPHPVKYSQTRPIVDTEALNGPAEEYCLTKSLDWAYEQEERVIDLDTGPGVYPYSRRHFLGSVTAGARMSDEAFMRLQEAVNKAERSTGRSIPLYRAKLSTLTYKVYIPGHHNPDVRSPD